MASTVRKCSMIRKACEDEIIEREERQWRTEFTVQEFEDNWDELFARVESGEHLTIIRPDGKAAVMMLAEDLNV